MGWFCLYTVWVFSSKLLVEETAIREAIAVRIRDRGKMDRDGQGEKNHAKINMRRQFAF